MGIFNGFFSGWFKNKPIPAPEPIIEPTPTPNIPKLFIQELLGLHNNTRRSKLILNDKLNIAAQKHAEWMAKNNNMSHIGEGRSSFWVRIKQAGYNPQAGGENVAMGYPTAAAVFKGWMNSKGHHANIVSGSYKEVGFGMSTSKNNSKYWCANFGSSISPSNTDELLEESLSGPLFNQE